MLTKNDLAAIGKLIDKKLSTDIAAIQARVAEIEEFQVRKLDILELRSLLRSVEKRITAVEGKMLNFATKDDLKKELRGVVRRKDLLVMERSLRKSINRLTDSVDNRLTDVEERVDKLDQHIDHPPIATS